MSHHVSIGFERWPWRRRHVDVARAMVGYFVRTKFFLHIRGRGGRTTASGLRFPGRDRTSGDKKDLHRSGLCCQRIALDTRHHWISYPPPRKSPSPPARTHVKRAMAGSSLHRRGPRVLRRRGVCLRGVATREPGERGQPSLGQGELRALLLLARCPCSRGHKRYGAGTVEESARGRERDSGLKAPDRGEWARLKESSPEVKLGRLLELFAEPARLCGLREGE